jgi:hypothetical protein
LKTKEVCNVDSSTYYFITHCDFLLLGLWLYDAQCVMKIKYCTVLTCISKDGKILTDKYRLAFCIRPRVKQTDNNGSCVSNCIYKLIILNGTKGRVNEVIHFYSRLEKRRAGLEW